MQNEMLLMFVGTVWLRSSRSASKVASIFRFLALVVEEIVAHKNKGTSLQGK